MSRCTTTVSDFSGKDFRLDTDSGGNTIIRTKNDCSFYSGTGNAPLAPANPTSPPANPSDGSILIEKWDDYTRYWQYDGATTTWSLLGDVAVGGGVTDHGGLTGLGDDDHTQYHNDTRGDARYYTKALLDGGQLDSRYYTESETDTLLLGKSDVGHTHPATDIVFTPFDAVTSTNVQDAIEEIWGDITIESGFQNRTDSTLTFDDLTRTFTIAPALTSFSFWVQHQKYTKSAPETLVIADTEGLHYIYYDGTGTLQETTTFTESIITEFSFVAFVYWDADNNIANFFGDERHGRVMDSTTHAYLHNVLSTQYDSGLGITLDSTGDGSLDAHAQIEVLDGVIRDEDIRIAISNGAPQTLSPIGQIPVFYRSGASGAWRKVTADNFPLTNTGTGRAAWNEWTGATWQLSEVGNADFVLYHIIATNDINEPIISVVGQWDYQTLTSAQAGAEVEINNLAFGPLDDALPEWKPIGTLIVETRNTFVNTVKSRFVATDDGSDYIDWREAQIGPGGGSSPTDHGNLSGLTADDHLQYHTDARGDARYYTKTLLDGGQLDTRYYTESETDTLLLGKSDVGHTHVASDITDFDTEVSNNVDVAANTTARHSHSNKALLDTYTQTEANLADAVAKKHDAVTVLDSSEIDFTLVGQQITASIVAGSIDETKLDASTNASLNLADSSVQPGDNVSTLTNDANYAAYTPDGGIALTGQLEQSLTDHGTKALGFTANCDQANVHELVVTASITVTLSGLVAGTVHSFVVYSSGGAYSVDFVPSAGTTYQDYSTTMNSNTFYTYRIVCVSSTNIFVSRTGPYF